MMTMLHLLQFSHGIQLQELLDPHVTSANSDHELTIENSHGYLLGAKGIGSFSNSNGFLSTMSLTNLSVVDLGLDLLDVRVVGWGDMV
jgi:hypothetical protein